MRLWFGFQLLPSTQRGSYVEEGLKAATMKTVCQTSFQWVSRLKKHMYSQEHRQKMIEVFKTDVPTGNGFFPHILLKQAIDNRNHKQPITGLSLLTLCFNKQLGSLVYLCHICEETCPSDRIVYHLSTGDHCSNYFNYTDPNILSYSWLPSMDMRAILKPLLTQEMKEKGPGTLQLLELPKNLMKRLLTSTYSEAMNTLREYNELSRLLQEVKPKRTVIQTYQKDSNRKHPLLGMQHLVECICDGATQKSYYLCTLCKLTLAAHMIIKHVLSFDHIFCYFKEWHPSTLLSKECYINHESFVCDILDFSRQTEEIHGTANTEIKQVILDPTEYSSVNFACYAEALKTLESKRNENKQGSLIVNIKPGRKLVSVVRLAEESSLPYSIILRCQDCSQRFNSIYQYLNHLPKVKHIMMLQKHFGQAKRDCGQQTGQRPYLGLYTYIQNCLKINEPVIGVSLIVTCINTEIKEDCIYVCFACEDFFSDSALKQHLGSICHLVNTLLYQNPWRLPFAWENSLNVTELKSLALEEEKEQGPNHVITMKVFDMPRMLFCSLLPATYEEVMKKLQLYHTVLKDAVPRRETYSKLKQNERFPLLGKQFMVMYDVRDDYHTRKDVLCLLCGRTLSENEFCTHVFSREHVTEFLDRFHPGSLTPDTDAETLLDLAKQAAHFHSISNVQVIKLDRPIWEPYTYHQAIIILESAKQRYKKGVLEPFLKPKMKLVPRETVKEMTKDHGKGSSQKNCDDQPATISITLMKDSENMTSQKPLLASSDTDHQEAVQLYAYIKKKNREPVIGLSSLYEFLCDQHDPVYFCQCCSLLVLEKNIINHVTGFDHWKIYLTGAQSLAPQPQMKSEEIRYLAENFESLNGYGEAQTVTLNEDIYNEILKQDSESALQTVKSLLTQNESSHVDVKTSDTSVFLQKQEKEQDMTENTQVVEKKFDVDLEDKFSNTGTNPTNMLPDSTKESAKDCIPSSTNEEPLKISITSQSSPASSSTGGTTKLTAAKHKSSMSPTSTVPTGSTTKSSRSTVSSTTATIAAPKVTIKCEPHRTSAMSDGCEHKTSHTEPHSSMTKMKPNENPPKVGLNHLIMVWCKRKKQIYCELCSVRLKNSKHPYSDTHRLNYVKMKFPEFRAEPLELQSKLDNIVAHLAEVEKNVQRRNKNIQVNHDVYKELGALSEEKAFEKIKTMLKKGAYWETSSPTTDAEALTQGCSVSSSSPFEMSSPDDGHLRFGLACADSRLSQSSQFTTITLCTSKEPEIDLPQNEVSGFSSDHQQKHETHRAGTCIIGASNLSTYLAVKQLETKPILGMGSVWECRGFSRDTFYLCQNCRMTLSVSDICGHMVSSDHQINCMKVDYPRFLYFMDLDNVPENEKRNILEVIGTMFSAQERSKKIDAQVVMLTPEGYESVQAAPFSEALEMLQNMKGQKPRVLGHSVSTSQQKEPENQQSAEECHQKETNAALKHTDYQHDNEARTQPQKCYLDKTVVVGGTDEMSSVLSNDVSTETFRNLSVQPELSLSAPQHQIPVPKLQEHEAEVHSESPSFSDSQHQTSQTQTVSPSDTCCQGKKRPAPPSVETHYTTNPHLKDPRQAKHARSSLEHISQCIPESAVESASFNVASTSTLLSPEDKGTEHDMTEYYKLWELVNQAKQNKVIAPSSNSSSEMNVVQRLDSKCADTDYRVKTNLPASKTLESTFPVPSVYDSTPDPHASNSSLETTTTINPSASSADPSDLQHQSSTSNECEKVSHLQPGSIQSTATIPNTWQALQLQCNPESTNTGFCQMPINPIITARPQPIRKMQLLTITNSFGTVAALEAYSQYSQSAYAEHGLSSYPLPQAGAGYITPHNPFVYAGPLYHSQYYPVEVPHMGELSSYHGQEMGESQNAPAAASGDAAAVLPFSQHNPSCWR
ncbi:uncharacterized protein LOC114865298 isoform X2 [Betta splendens]|uniref:Uncharacterized protein LOC114865298 isoform X2 n=1 Tax=Betta splendens TaxID=158456 RepID=A0A6P7NVT2_BETSP|nr:uncharacterized protein LOC114865298 isoform X2 [Betta splendens]